MHKAMSGARTKTTTAQIDNPIVDGAVYVRIVITYCAPQRKCQFFRTRLGAERLAHVRGMITVTEQTVVRGYAGANNMIIIKIGGDA